MVTGKQRNPYKENAQCDWKKDSERQSVFLFLRNHLEKIDKREDIDKEDYRNENNKGIRQAVKYKMEHSPVRPCFEGLLRHKPFKHAKDKLQETDDRNCYNIQKKDTVTESAKTSDSDDVQNHEHRKGKRTNVVVETEVDHTLYCVIHRIHFIQTVRKVKFFNHFYKKRRKR